MIGLLSMTLFSAPAGKTAKIESLTVEYVTTPIGIDVAAPRFGWRMAAPAGVRDCAQTAYRIMVKNPAGGLMWDSGKTAKAESLEIPYAGAPLQAATRYDWTATVWDRAGAAATESSWFETGLMNPDPGLSAWDGATWIGGGDEDLVLYSPYLPAYAIGYSLAIAEGSSRAGFVLGANDSRLMDKNKNIFQVQSARDKSFIKVELDVSGVDGTDAGRAKISVYRSGYSDKDTPDKSLKSFAVKKELINPGNKYASHAVEIKGLYGDLTVSLDGQEDFFEEIQPAVPEAGSAPRVRRATVNVNPLGTGTDIIPFGMLCDIGFSIEAGQKAAFADLKVSHVRKPGHVLFREDLAGPAYDGLFKAFAADPDSGFRVEGGAYRLSGGKSGAFVAADPSRNAMPMLRTRFAAADRKIRAARLYITARGIYEAYLNGKRVGDDYYNPGLTQYNKTHMYQTYDVTSLLAPGPNVLGAALGEGWWSGQMSFTTDWNYFGDRPSLLAKLVIAYEDGSRDVIVSNARDWTYFNRGPIVYSSLQQGEVYDAAREAAVEGWTTAGYDDRTWEKAAAVTLEGSAFPGFDYKKLILIGQIGGNPGVFKTLTAQSVKEVRPGVFVYDMGQNFVGVPLISFPNGKAGRRITLRVAEMLYPDLKESGRNVGMIMTENYRAALCQDRYVMKDGPQVFQPRFTSRGYQYLEITGLSEALPLTAVKGVTISSIRELSAGYESSNPKVNRLWSNLVWSNVDNFLSVPTDCPQRNERMGWGGDISVFSRTATYVSNAGPFLRRHMLASRDMQDANGKFNDIAPIGHGFGGVLWGSAGMTVPWEAYRQYGDVELLREHYPAMTAYIDFLAKSIRKETGLSYDSALGDWLGPQNDQLGTDFLVTAYHVYDLEIMTRVASLLGRSDDAARFQVLRDERKAFFNKTFVNADKKALGTFRPRRSGGARAVPDGLEFRVADTQTAYAVGLALGAFSDENIPFMAANLKAAVERENKDDDGILRPRYSLMTGFIGTAWISQALSDRGMNDLAYRLLQNDTYPSWLYSVNQGATTIWERLNGYTIENGFGGLNGMNSFNHYSFGAVGHWLMAYSLGIQRDEPGFRKFILRPEPDPTGNMTWAKGHYDSMYGRIESSWRREGGRLIYEAVVPANTTATLYLPAASAEAVTEGGKPAAKAAGVAFVKYENGRAVYRLASGRYSFLMEKEGRE
ncbi:MAG: family 78 glycoside hydrolase catalytic domain [Acidobacteriota bacterium]|nr:family 78 glycoside hydrolase catalytic domain [Acidobacteriota bacterium]